MDFLNKKYIIFDLDGTLIDSIGVWNNADKKLILNHSNRNIAENIIPYSTDTYSQLSTDYKFRIPEGTMQLYLDKGYPLEKLLEGITSITLTSDKNI